MTLAQMLLVPLVLLMAIDQRQTIKGLSLGAVETNLTALALIQRFGIAKGIVIYESGFFLVALAAVVLFPSQWALPLFLNGAAALTVIGNDRALAAIRKGGQA